MNGTDRATLVTRRSVLRTAGGIALLTLTTPARAQTQALGELDAAVRAFVGESKVTRGKVTLDIPPLVENGNAVPLSVVVDSPMSAESFVRRIGVFNEKNPQPNVAIFHLTPHSGRAQVATRVRLATTQKLTAIAELSDGTFWSGEAEAIVTLAACLEDL